MFFSWWPVSGSVGTLDILVMVLRISLLLLIGLILPSIVVIVIISSLAAIFFQ